MSVKDFDWLFGVFLRISRRDQRDAESLGRVRKIKRIIIGVVFMRS